VSNFVDRLVDRLALPCRVAEPEFNTSRLVLDVCGGCRVGSVVGRAGCACTRWAGWRSRSAVGVVQVSQDLKSVWSLATGRNSHSVDVGSFGIVRSQTAQLARHSSS